MTAGKYSFAIEQGATFTRAITYTDAAGAVPDLTGYTARMKIRPTKESATVLVSLTDGAGITLAATAPNITISISATDTAALDMTDGQIAVYDLEIVSGSVVTRVIEGNINFDAEVTY